MIDATLGPDTRPVWVTDPVTLSRAHVLWEYGNNATDAKGSISVEPGSLTVTGSGTAWETGDEPIRIGDSFIIPKEFTSGDGGSAYGNEDRYIVIDIESDTSLIVDKAPQGSQAESGILYSANRLYISSGATLFEYNQTTDIYKKLGGVSDPNTYIARIWHNPRDPEYPIFGVTLTQLGGWDDIIVESMRVFRFKWDGDTPVFDVFGEGDPIAGVFSGFWTIRESDYNEFAGLNRNLVGNFEVAGNDTESAPVTIPFAQTCLNQSINGESRYHQSIHWFQASGFMDEIDPIEETPVVRDKRELQISSSQTFISGTEKNVGAGHWHLMSANNKEPPLWNAISARYTMGQSGFIEFNPEYGDKGTIWFSQTFLPVQDTDKQGDTNKEYDFTYCMMPVAQDDPDDPSPGTPDYFVVDSSSFDIGGHNYDQGYLPMASAPDPNSEGVFIAVSRFPPGLANSDPLQTAILHIPDVSAAAFGEPDAVVEFYRYPVGTAGKTILEMVAGPENLSTITFSCEEFPGDSSAPYPYFIHSHELAGAGIGTVYTSNLRLQGLVAMNIGAETVPDKLFVQACEKGQLIMIDDDRTDQAPGTVNQAPILTAMPAVEDATSILHCVVSYSPALKEFYWVSSPVPLFTVANKIEGIFRLCKFSPVWPARVGLADFSGKSIWEALSAVAEVTEARFGFRPDGNFYLKSKPRHENTVYEFSNVNADKLLSISVDDGSEDIINEAIRVPHTVGLGDIEVRIRTGPDSKVKNFSFNATQRTERPITVKLYCIRGGTVNSAQWAYTTLRGVTKTKLEDSYAVGSPSISVDEPLDVVYGSAIRVYGLDTNDDEISATAKAGRQILFSSVPLVTQIGGEDPGSMNSEDTLIRIDGGIFPDLTTTSPDGLGRPLTSGDVIVVSQFGSEANLEYMVITGMEPSRIFVSRGSGGGESRASTSHDEGEEIRLLRNGREIFTAEPLSNVYDFISGDETDIEHPDENAWSENLYTDPAFPDAGNLTSQGLFKLSNGEFVTIGGSGTPHSTGISLQVLYTGDDLSDERFQEGDLIRVTSPGLVLIRNDASIKIYRDLTSQARHNKRTDDDSNEFLSTQTAEFAVRRLVQENKDPKYIFTVQSILTPWLMPLDVVDIQDPALLPRAAGHSEAAYITSITYNLMTQGLQTIVAKSINPY